jgi:hypothetical protein
MTEWQSGNAADSNPDDEGSTPSSVTNIYIGEDVVDDFIRRLNETKKVNGFEFKDINE